MTGKYEPLEPSVKTPGGVPIGRCNDAEFLKRKVLRWKRIIFKHELTLKQLKRDNPHGTNAAFELRDKIFKAKNVRLVYIQRLVVLGQLGPSNEQIESIKQKILSARKTGMGAVKLGNMELAECCVEVEQRARAALEFIGVYV